MPGGVLRGLEKTTYPALTQATWGWVEMTGTFRAAGDGGGPTIALNSIRIDAP